MNVKTPEARVTAAYRLPAWLHAAVKIDAAIQGVPTHKLVETILANNVSTGAKRDARETRPVPAAN